MSSRKSKDNSNRPPKKGILPWRSNAKESPSKASNESRKLSATQSLSENSVSIGDAIPLYVFDKKLGTNDSLCLDKQVYFHGVLPREEIITLLREDGDFLVRYTKKGATEEVVLSVKENSPKHFIIKHNNEGKFHLEGPMFTTVHELIKYYWKNQIPVTERSGVLLKRAVPRESWELHHDDVKLVKKIGEGNFGDVYKGTMKKPFQKDKTQDVAIKLCRANVNENDRLKFLQEARIMRKMRHPNIIRLIGVCIQRDPIMIILELACGGSLDKYLREKGPGLSVSTRVNLCHGSACGMAFMEAENCIHRDLSARNCLLGANDLVKIADFGLSRKSDQGFYQIQSARSVPVRWMAPEALKRGRFTIKTDVWAFGVLMWEIFSNAEQPYSQMTNTDVMAKVVKGEVQLETPANMPEEIADIMKSCWRITPETRPTFSQLKRNIDSIKNKK